MNEFSPFSVSPNPNALYQTPALKSIIYQARGTIHRRQGLVCLLGDAGMGKSTVLRYLMAEYDAIPSVETVFVPTPKFSTPFGLYKELSSNFELPMKRSLVIQQEVIGEYLTEQYSAGRNVVIFVDEAQLLKDDLLEVIRALLNYETNTAKLVQVVLAGQLELRARINSDRNKPLKNRIHSYAVLNPLTQKEMAAMLALRLEQFELPSLFSDPVLNEIFNITKGVPRTVLKLCDKAYDYMMMGGAATIDMEMVESAAVDAAIITEEEDGE
jgi:general secretion pathway protein A